MSSIPVLRPRVMRTAAGIAAVQPQAMIQPQRPASPYDPNPGMGARPGAGQPWATSATGSTAAPPLPAIERPGAAQGQSRITVTPAASGRQNVATSYGAGTGQPQVVGGSVRASAMPPPRTMRSPAASGFQEMMNQAGILAGAQGPRPTQQTMSAAPAAAQQQPAQQQPSGGGGGGAPENKGPGRRSNKMEIGGSGSGLAPDDNGDGQADTTADDTPDTRAGRAERAEAAGFTVDPNTGKVYDKGGGGTWEIGSIDDDEWWAEFAAKYSQAQGADDVDLSQVPEEYRDSAQALADSGNFWIDPETGDVYQKDASGSANAGEAAPVGNIYDGELTGRARAVWDSGETTAKTETPEQIIADILGWDAEQETDGALQEKIAAERQATAYATGQGIQSALGAGSRSRMGAGWMAGTAGDLSAQGNLQAASQAADMRLEHERQNIQLRMDMLNKQYQAILAMANYSDNGAARAAAAEIEQQRQAFQQRMDEINYQRSQQVSWKDLFGLGGSVLGGVAGGLVSKYG
jgi:hypothetical protein